MKNEYIVLLAISCVGLLLFGCLSEKNATAKGVVLSKSQDSSQTYVHLASNGAQIKLNANTNSKFFDDIIVGKICTINTDSGGEINAVNCE